ncbi:unnamed protein product [Moneuplotes crassus]|uniref:EF-hand domain-containing protein n=3 Tax=Euplotes crassus TaxID=5936 RepID=A0AAD1X615_EUPCR|nr:unnamed protein product [Moneuplotes crassus]
MMVVCILEGWGKFIKQEMPSREYLERAAKIIISATPESSSDERITMKILGDWIDQNENMMSMLMMFEPSDKIEERLALFLPFKRDSSHLPILLNKYLGKKIMVDNNMQNFAQNKNFRRSEKEEPRFNKTSIAIALNKRRKNQKDGRRSQPRLSSRITNSIAIPLSINRLSDPGFYKLRKLKNTSSLPNLDGESAKNLISRIKEQQSLEESPSIKAYRRRSLVHHKKDIKNVTLKIGTKKLISKRPRNKNIITVKEKTIKRKDVILLKEEFDSFYNNNKYSNGPSHANLPCLSKGGELDPEIAKKVSFKDTLRKYAPGASKEDMEKMLSWAKKEEEIEERGIMNYKIQKYNNNEKVNKNVRLKQIKDYIHIFDGLDKDRDSMLTFKDFRNSYSHNISDKDIEGFFTRFGKTIGTDHDNDLISRNFGQQDSVGEQSKLTLIEYLKIMLPQGSILDEKVTQEALDYHKKLLLRKKPF